MLVLISISTDTREHNRPRIIMCSMQ